MLRCQKEKIIPDGLKVHLEPSISNHNEKLISGLKDYNHSL